jgi:omega-3 fatty acid desaturase (delta-15 desaturase)
LHGARICALLFCDAQRARPPRTAIPKAAILCTQPSKPIDPQHNHTQQNTPNQHNKQDGTFDLSAPPPFSLADVRAAIPAECFDRSPLRSFAHLAFDVAVVLGLAAAAYTANTWFVWPLYWIAQGTMFWALFVVGHDCGHQSFSPSRFLNDFVGNIVHATIMVPYHGWRVSHRKHHGVRF